MSNAGHRPEADNHLLIHHEHRNQERERPQEGQAEVLARLTVGGDTAGVVVADHHDEPGTHDGE